MAGSITGSVVGIQYLDNVAIQMEFTGSPVGTLAVQGSVNYAQNAQGTVTNTGNWITFTTSAVAAAGDVLFDLNQLSFPWIRVIYTRSSGTGTLDGYISAKAV